MRHNAPSGHDWGSQPFLWLEGMIATIHSVPLGTQHKQVECSVPKGQHKQVECSVPKGTPDKHRSFFQP